MLTLHGMAPLASPTACSAHKKGEHCFLQGAAIATTAPKGALPPAAGSAQLDMCQTARRPSWGDVVVPASAVQLYMTPDGLPIKLGGGARCGRKASTACPLHARFVASRDG